MKAMSGPSEPLPDADRLLMTPGLDLSKVGFGFSAGGLLFPYYIGIIQQLRQYGIITDTTR